MTRAGFLRILAPGPSTTVQDLGRPSLRRLGIPVAGTLCPDWLFLGNGLLGNAPDAAALEFRALGPRFKAEVDGVCIVSAGPARLQIDTADGRQEIEPWTATHLRNGDTVTVGPVTSGTVGLICVSGGIQTQPVLGSRATYARASLGGLNGSPLAVGDRLPVAASPSDANTTIDVPEDNCEAPLRVILGPQDDHFEKEQVDRFLATEFKVTPQVDRMGMRLEGPALMHLKPEMAEIVSDGIVPGAVQVPGNGQPIVLLADGQTVGGYPKIATVISADLPRLARLAPGGSVRFSAVAVKEAEDALQDQQTGLVAILAAAKPAYTAGRVDLQKLYAENLISGVGEESEP